MSSASSASLPVAQGCFKVTTTSAVVVEVCGPEGDPAWVKYANVATGGLALVVSAIAVIVAWKTFDYMRVQSAQARKESVRDEYWLRTVVSPTCIEPLLAYVAELRSTLPGSTPPPTVAQLNAFFSTTAQRLTEFSFSFQSLSLVDDSLSSSVQLALQAIEDELSDYVGQLGQFVSGTAALAPSRSDAVTKLHAGMLKLFGLIQEHQGKIA